VGHGECGRKLVVVVVVFVKRRREKRQFSWSANRVYKVAFNPKIHSGHVGKVLEGLAYLEGLPSCLQN
jgi:hypothetical protein